MDPTVSPYLTVQGATKAIDFYKRVFGAEENMRMMADDGKRIMHASLGINGGTVMLSDEFPEYPGSAAPVTLGGTPVAVSLSFDTARAVDETHARAISEGATSDMDPNNPFWGGRFAVLRDPFGHRWLLSSPQEG